MIGQIVEFTDLQRLSGYDRRADVERWAATVGLPVRPCRAGVWTTTTALNQALGLAANDDSYPAEVV